MNITRDRRPRRRRLLFLLVFAWPVVARPPDLARAEAHTGLDSRLPLARGGFIATAHGSSAAHVLPAAMAYSPGKRTLAAAEFVDDRLSGGLAIWQRERIA